jgi:hypothetical protein
MWYIFSMKSDHDQSIESSSIHRKDLSREQQTGRESVLDRSERRDRLVDQLKPLLSSIQALESERVRWSYEFMRETVFKRPKEIFLFVEADRLRGQVNRLLDQIDALRPEGVHPVRRMHTNAKEIAVLGALAARHGINILKRKTGIIVRPQEDVDGEEMLKSISRYLFGSNDYTLFRVLDVWQTVNELVEGYWKPLELSWSALAIDEGAEIENTGDQRGEEYVHRSYRNMRERVRVFMTLRSDRVLYRPTTPDDGAARSFSDVAREAVEHLKHEREREEKSVRFVYYEQPEDIQSIIDSMSIKQLSELTLEEQERNKKSEWKTVQEILEQRREVEHALGWMEEKPVHHLVAETSIDERLSTTGPADNYGFVGFVLDLDQLSISPTFTEGDSLNLGPLPNGYPHERGGEAVRQRQIIREHVPLAKALLHDAQQRDPDRLRNMLRYVEVQVGGVSGAELFQTVKEITLHKRAMDLYQQQATFAERDQWSVQRTKLETWCVQRGIPIRIISESNS